MLGAAHLLSTLKPVHLRKVTLIALEQVHFVFESLLMLKPFMKPIMNNQQINYMIKFFNGFEQAEQEMRQFIIGPLLRYSLNDHIDIFNDIQHLNWTLPSVKTQTSSFVGKVLRGLLQHAAGPAGAQALARLNAYRAP